MQNDKSGGERFSSFSRSLGVLIGALGAAAILGAEPAHIAIGRLVGLFLTVGGAMGLIVHLAKRRPRLGRAILAWSLIALAAGVTMAFKPTHGVPSASLLIGMVLVGHGLAASSIAWKGRKARDAAILAVSFAAPALVLTGLALLFGAEPSDRGDEILIGTDMLLFGLYLILGRAILESADSGPGR